MEELARSISNYILNLYVKDFDELTPCLIKTSDNTIVDFFVDGTPEIDFKKEGWLFNWNEEVRRFNVKQHLN